MTLKIGPKQTWARITSAHIGETYAGMLEGIPTKDQNDKKIERLKEQAVKAIGTGPFGESGEKVYGKRAHPIIIAPTRRPPNIMGGVENLPKCAQDHYPNPETLPRFYVFAMLDGRATDNKFCGALALVIFFVDNLEQSVEGMIQDACKDEIWEHMAYNYDI